MRRHKCEFRVPETRFKFQLWYFTAAWFGAVFFFLFSQSKTKFPYLPTGDTSTCFSGRYEEDVKYEI